MFDSSIICLINCMYVVFLTINLDSSTKGLVKVASTFKPFFFWENFKLTLYDSYKFSAKKFIIKLIFIPPASKILKLIKKKYIET